MGNNKFNYKNISDTNPYGILNVFNMTELPFDCKRIFTVSTNSGITRGFHAHFKCNQLLVCISGKIEVIIDNTMSREKYILESNGESIYIPSGIWSEQKYLDSNSILLTFCDQEYDEDDYIRNYKDYINFFKK